MKERLLANLFFFLGALLAGLAVTIGAYGAHASMLDETQVAWIEKGARYQMYHGIALVLTGMAMAHSRKFTTLTMAAGFSFIGGIVCFSGSLYAMVFTPFEGGYITPIGGLLFMLGWVLLALGGPGEKS